MSVELYIPKNPGDIIRDVEEFSKTIVSTLVNVSAGLVINAASWASETVLDAAFGLTMPKGMFGEAIDYSE